MQKAVSMLEITDLSIAFGEERVLQHFSCSVKQGDFVCITGKSGCGKSSLLKAFIGFTPFVGCICVGGVELSEKTCDIIRRKTAYLPQDLSFPVDTVQEAVARTFRIGMNRQTDVPALALKKDFSKLGLESEILDKRMSEVSGGQRQRIMLATIAQLDKDVWLLDEPTAALDAVSRNLVIGFLQEKQREGKTIVAVTHDMEFAGQCTSIITIE